VRRRVAPGRLAAPGLLLALCSVALLAAGCSAGSSGGQVASLPGHSAGPGGTATLTQAQSDQDFVNFAHCMRSHGVQMSDPFHRPGHTGLTIAEPPHNAATRAAWAACGHYIQPIVSMKNAGAASWAARNLNALTRYAQCMRAHDINMLDPTPLGALNLGNVPGMANNDYGRYSPQFRAADAACRHLLPPGVHDDGTGP
jgi:hypothetical protein